MSGCAKNRCFSRLLLLVAILMFTTARQAHGLAQQHVGNKPLNENNYQQWKGIIPVINHESRVYHTWVNGNEHFYYRCSTEALNDILQKFAALDVDVREVVLRPGPEKVMTFDKEPIGYNCLLHIQGGISRHKEEGTNVFDKYPTMTVFVDGSNITLERIKIPAGVALIEVADLRYRYLKGLYSKDRRVRGYASYFLARVDVYNESNVLTIAILLDDEDMWVRSMAANALSRFGRKARPALPALRRRMQDSNEKRRDYFQKTIDKIEAAEDTTEAEEKHRRILKKISQFRKSLDRENSESNTELKEKNTQNMVDKKKREPIYDPNADVMPTFAELAAASQHMPSKTDGLSIVPTLTGKDKKQKKHEFLYWEWHRYNWGKRKNIPTGLMQAVRMGDWKVVRHSSDVPFELYNLGADIGEKNNVAAKHPAFLAKIESFVATARTEPRPQIEPKKPNGKQYMYALPPAIHRRYI